jgi:RND superfamily putative drug exporter
VLAGLGRQLARRAGLVVVGWVLLVALGFATAAGLVTGEGVFDRLSNGAPQVPGESKDGLDLLARTAPAGNTVFLLLDGVDPADPALRQAITEARADVAAIDGVLTVQDPYAPDGPTPSPYLAADGRAVLVAVALRRDLPDAAAVEAAVDRRLETVAPAGARVLIGSNSKIFNEITGQVREDLSRGELIALPVSLLIMVVVFGGFIAAGMPLLGALASIAGALASLLGVSYLIDLDASVVNIVSVLGLGLCIDYGLLVVSRYREELRALGIGPHDGLPRAQRSVALAATMASAGRTVLFSALTVAISLTGLLVFSSPFLQAAGAAGVSVVLVALLVALTLVPALIVLAGKRLARPGLLTRIPGLLRRFGDVAPPEGFFSRLARRVQRRAALVVIAVLVVLAALALPALGMRMVSSGVDLLPASSGQRQLFDQLDHRFPLVASPGVTVVTRLPAAEAATWAQSLATLPGVAGVSPPQERPGPDGPLQVIGVRPAGDDASDAARQLVREVREHRPDAPTWVTGSSALLVDFLDGTKQRAPYAVALVVLATFVLLFLMTGSVLVPLKALLMNVASLGASFGVVVWVFQDGHLRGLLGFTPVGGIETTLPSLLLAFGFGLAMDYEVFLLSRIKELYDSGVPNDEAVARGLQRSGRIITSAALVVVVVFAGFVFGDLLIIKETGLALAVAVAVDATLVRILLVPATMTLLGEWNWWAPGPLRRLHARFGLREAEAPVPPAAP